MHPHQQQWQQRQHPQQRQPQRQQQQQYQQHQQPINNDIYIPTMVTQKVILPFESIGRNVKNVLEQHLAHAHEGKCNGEGYVRPRSTQLLAHSSGTLTDHGSVAFEVVYEYQACNPVEGMIIKCTVQTVTNAGLHAHMVPESSPIIVFVSRDHHFSNPHFSKIKVGDEITVRVIGRHFELNDPVVSVIADLSHHI